MESRVDTQSPYAQAMPKVRRFLGNERIDRLAKELRLCQRRQHVQQLLNIYQSVVIFPTKN